MPDSVTAAVHQSTTRDTRAEYKQVTVLFADVVHSMYIASAVGAERLREIMAELVNITTAVVKRYGGTVDKFTGDGIMAVFGAPLALEDHAVRACLAALEIQDELARLAAQVRDHDGVELALRIGLNSGQVIAGEVGSASLGYTTIGEQVGMAQRMESVAPPGGVMLSASTARLVDGAAALSEPESVRIKGADEGVPVCRLLGMRQDRTVRRAESNLVGRRWEMSAVEGLLDRAIDGHGAVVGVVGSPGIGKSRLVREVSAMAGRRVMSRCSPPSANRTPADIPFHVVARLLRAATGVGGLDGPAARDAGAGPGARCRPRGLAAASTTCWASPIPMSRCPNRSGCPAAAVDRAGECRVVGPRKPRRSMSLRTPIGSMRSASRCWPSSSR